MGLLRAICERMTVDTTMGTARRLLLKQDSFSEGDIRVTKMISYLGGFLMLFTDCSIITLRLGELERLGGLGILVIDDHLEEIGSQNVKQRARRLCIL